MQSVDEKIALLEKEARKQRKNQESGQEGIINSFGLEDVLKGMDVGTLTYESETLRFEKHMYFDGACPWMHIMDYYDEGGNQGILEQGEQGIQVLTYSNLEKGMNLMLNYSSICPEYKGLKEMEKNLIKAYQDLGNSYIPIKKIEMGEVDYITFVVPANKYKVYNISFIAKNKKYLLTGHLNCIKDEFILPELLLEAMVIKLNTFLMEGEEVYAGSNNI